MLGAEDDKTLHLNIKRMLLTAATEFLTSNSRKS